MFISIIINSYREINNLRHDLQIGNDLASFDILIYIGEYIPQSHMLHISRRLRSLSNSYSIIYITK
jgi:hypothetical protein